MTTQVIGLVWVEMWTTLKVTSMDGSSLPGPTVCVEPAVRLGSTVCTSGESIVETKLLKGFVMISSIQVDYILWVKCTISIEC